MDLGSNALQNKIHAVEVYALKYHIWYTWPFLREIEILPKGLTTTHIFMRNLAQGLVLKAFYFRASFDHIAELKVP